MKKSKDVFKLPVISIAEGEELGTIVDLLIDLVTGHVQFLVVDNSISNREAKVLEFEHIKCIGINAITIKSKFNLVSYKDDVSKPKNETSFMKIVKTKVYTENGTILGILDDVLIDDTKQWVDSFIVSNEDKKINIVTSAFVVCGKKASIVKENYLEERRVDAERKLQRKKNIEAQKLKYKQSAKREKATENIENSVKKGKKPEKIKENSQKEKISENIKNNSKKQNNLNNAQDTEENIFLQKQKEFLIGRICTSNVVNKKGQIIFKKGDVITEEFLNKISSQKKLTELLMKASRKPENK